MICDHAKPMGNAYHGVKCQCPGNSNEGKVVLIYDKCVDCNDNTHKGRWPLVVSSPAPQDPRVAENIRLQYRKCSGCGD